MPVNYRLLRIEIDRQADTAIFSKMKPLIKQEFESHKEILMEKFEQHPVTQELEAGPDAESSFVQTAHGGNLYSLLGFYAGENPTEALREVIRNDVRLNLSQTRRQVHTNVIEFATPVRIPTLDTVHEKMAREAPVEWTSRGWTQLLEKGIPWFGSYLYKAAGFGPASRSGTGIEAKRKDGTLIKVRSGSMRPIRYVSELLADFKTLIGGK